MTAIVRDSLALPIVPDSDVRAIAAYFTESTDANLRARVIEATTLHALATSPLGSGPEYDPDYKHAPKPGPAVVKRYRYGTRN